jgi:hypothetical protein
MKRRVLLLLALMILSISPVIAQDTEDERKTLKGIKSITVSVEHLNPAIEGKGLTVEQLQTDVELKLRLAGIKVASSNLSSNVKLPDGFLSVQVGVILGTNGGKETGRYAFALNIFFYQSIRLVRDPSIESMAPTWQTTAVAIGPNITILSDQCRKAVSDAVDQFINAYFSVNPK